MAVQTNNLAAAMRGRRHSLATTVRCGQRRAFTRTSLIYTDKAAKRTLIGGVTVKNRIVARRAGGEDLPAVIR